MLVKTSPLTLSFVDNNLNIVDVWTVFGHYVKFTVTLNESGVGSSQDSQDVSKSCLKLGFVSFTTPGAPSRDPMIST